MRFRCLHCSEDLNAEISTCVNCSKQYTFLFKVYPLVVKTPSVYLTSLISNLRFVKNRISKNISSVENNNLSFHPLLIQALESRLDLVKAIQKELESALHILTPSDHLHSKGRKYILPFRYFNRDLTVEYHFDEEIEVYEKTITSLIGKFSSSDAHILFVASASEQMPYKLSKDMKVDCLDISPTSIMTMHLIQMGKINQLYEINRTGVTNKDNKVVSLTPKWRENHSTVHYSIGDICYAPYSSDLFEIVCTHFFIDTMPLHKYLNEICRILKPGGIWINYGPLYYHFKQIEFAYAEDEIKEILKEKGFEILYEDHIESYHCRSMYSHKNTLYNNWVFVAKYVENK